MQEQVWGHEVERRVNVEAVGKRKHRLNKLLDYQMLKNQVLEETLSKKMVSPKQKERAVKGAAERGLVLISTSVDQRSATGLS